MSTIPARDDADLTLCEYGIDCFITSEGMKLLAAALGRRMELREKAAADREQARICDLLEQRACAMEARCRHALATQPDDASRWSYVENLEDAAANCRHLIAMIRHAPVG